MLLDITASTYKAINDVMLTGKQFVAAKGIWLQIHKEYSIGVRQGQQIELNAQSRIDIAKLVKAQTDLDPRKDNFSDLQAKSRTEISLLTRHEKFISRPPRSAFVEVRILSANFCVPAYCGMLVLDVLSLEMNRIISIENFDTFANIQRTDLDCICALPNEDLVIVFAGDNMASPAAIQELRAKSDKPWVHFGDYDPAGIHISIFRLKADAIILPDFASVKDILLGLSKRNVFEEQYAQLNSIIKVGSGIAISDHISFIAEQSIAVMQEQLIAHKVKLKLFQILSTE